MNYYRIRKKIIRFFEHIFLLRKYQFTVKSVSGDIEYSVDTTPKFILKSLKTSRKGRDLERELERLR